MLPTSSETHTYMCDRKKGVVTLYPPSSPESIDPDVTGIKNHLDVTRLRQHCHRHGAGVQATVRLCGRYTLHSVDTSLVFQTTIHSITCQTSTCLLHRRQVKVCNVYIYPLTYFVASLLTLTDG